MAPRIRIRALLAGALVATLAAGTAACGGDDRQDTGGPVTLRYGLWDSNQQPVYQQCANAFEKQNPDIRISIQLNNWNDYWGGLARGFIGETAPDVFTDHLAKYPQFAQSEVIEPLNRYIERDGFDVDQYQPGLAELWVTPDGRRYGLPKDWDTVAIVSNQTKLREAGITNEQLDNATWNPDDGGTFEDIVARLSVDKNGKRGDEPGFDPLNVATYGLGLDPGGLTYGQTTWGGFARSLGFELLDKNPWGTKYHYDDPRFIKTIAWWRHMIEQGYMPPLAESRSLGQAAMFQGGNVALSIDGDWMIPTYSATEDFEVHYHAQPAGPEGSWSMYNGLADAIWVGTPYKEQAWQWVKFLASPECQNIVGSKAVVFPAIPEATRRSVATHRKNGVDVSAFTSYLENDRTFLYPITDKAPQINLIVQPTMEKILIGSESPEALKDMNSQVNNLLEFSD
ncbi:MAG TPA: sugar ABC transporter substrate-binding protein [Solirubrobacteraceae bacterium]|nr:sugar ABC transporter substrate-binding protein [Solirubrobacteraceae bacterium]